jgi:hypothetical protein
MPMVRTFLAGLVVALLVAAAPVGVCGEAGDFAVLARLGVGQITDGAQADETLASGTPRPYGEKSVGKAMLLSAVIPGLGQIYAGGTRGYAVGGAMVAVDAFAATQYISKDGKGDDQKAEYQRWGDTYYSRDRFYDYVRDTVVVYSGYEGFSDCTDPVGSGYDSAGCWASISNAFPLSETNDAVFYEQIGVEDRYVFGWLDWDPYGVQNHEDLWLNWEPSNNLPSGIPTTSSSKDKYNQMRKEADDYYSKADQYAWIMVIGRVVSMVDAAILVRLRNRDLSGFGTNPRLTFDAKLSRNPNFKVALKMRF